MDVQKDWTPIVTKNQQREKESSHHPIMIHQSHHNNNHYSNNTSFDPMDQILDMREYDVPYYVRVCIDLNVRVGAWYEL